MNTLLKLVMALMLAVAAILFALLATIGLDLLGSPWNLVLCFIVLVAGFLWFINQITRKQ